MRILCGPPPLFDEIAAVFPGARKPGVLFCWGDKIFAPGLVGTVGPELIAHEQVHCDRQGSDIAGWWRRYMADPVFRLQEELPAHVAEFQKLCELHRDRWVSGRTMRRAFAARVGRKLSAPLYGNLITVEEAKKALLAA